MRVQLLYSVVVIGTLGIFTSSYFMSFLIIFCSLLNWPGVSLLLNFLILILIFFTLSMSWKDMHTISFVSAHTLKYSDSK